MKARSIVILVIVFLIFGVLFYFVNCRRTSDDVSCPNYEAVGISKRVIDGDTFVVKVRKMVDPHEGVESGKERVRLARIDTEEISQSEAASKRERIENMNQSEYEDTKYYRLAFKAKEILEKLVPAGTKVFLDIDDLAYGNGPYRGYYGRLIAVVYVKREDKWINVNARLISQEYSKNSESEYPISTKFCSEFDPYSWIDRSYPFK